MEVKPQLIDRAHTKRSVYRVLGDSQTSVPTYTDTIKTSNVNDQIDTDIFDDSDFYQFFLKEVIDSGDATGQKIKEITTFVSFYSPFLFILIIS